MQMKNKLLLFTTNILTYLLAALAFLKIENEPSKAMVGLLLLIPVAVSSLTMAMTAEDKNKNAKPPKEPPRTHK